MMLHTLVLILASVNVAVPAAAELADSPAQRAFERAYFLESYEGDLESAAEVYATVADSRRVPEDLRAAARTRQQSCEEDIRSRDLASLMPPDTVVYAELHGPGEHLENLAEMLGLTGDPLQALSRDVNRMPIPDTPGLVLPERIFLSPALIEQAKRFRGLAVAFTGIEPSPAGCPVLGGAQAVMVLHPGEALEVRGMIETAAQFVQPVDPIGGFGTIRIDPGILVTFTHRLVVAGTNRDLIAGVVERLSTDRGDSLAERADMRELAGQRDHSLLFAYVDAKGAVQTLYKAAQHDPDMMQEMGVPLALLDAPHMQSLALSLGSSREGLFGEFHMLLDEGHSNFVYNLIRTPPMTGKSLRGVPAGSAVVLAVGINPATGQHQQIVDMKADNLQYVTGLDLGRELFANVEEVSMFLLPGERRENKEEMPDFGFVIAAANPDKSQAMWDYLLTIPSKVMGQQELAPTTKQIAGHEVQVYSMPDPDAPQIRVARADDAIVIAPTDVAIAASLKAYRSGKSVLDDPAVRAATSRMTKDTSVFVMAHAGRCAQVGGQYCPPSELPTVTMVGEALGSTIFTLLADESPTKLRVSGTLTGLPRVENLIKLAGKAMGSQSSEQRYLEADDEGVIQEHDAEESEIHAAAQ